MLDETAKSWKRASGGVIVEDGADKKLATILKNLEPCISGGRLDIGQLSRSNSAVGAAAFSRSNNLPNGGGPLREDSQTSLGLSGLDVDDDAISQNHEANLPPSTTARSFLKVLSAYEQPRLMYSTTKKSLETVSTPPSFFPPASHKTAMFRNRYNLVHQRILRNELFQTNSFATTTGLQRSASGSTTQQAYKLTPIASLLGRSGSTHLLLGLVVNAPSGDLALTDLSGSILLDLSSARPVQEDGAWYCPGMIVIVEGVYEEDGSSASLGAGSGVGGMIGGRFLGISIGGPPAERRDVTLGIGDAGKGDGVHTSVGAGFGWVDFLGVGSEKAMGGQMRRMQRRVLGRSETGEGGRRDRTKIVILGECTLDSPRTLEGIRGVLQTYAASGDLGDVPLAIVFMGNFVSAAALAGSVAAGGSVEYKEYFDALAAILGDFSKMLANTTLIFVPGDNDPWPSSFSAGAATPLPRQGVPEIFTTRIKRAVAAANQEAGRREEGAGEIVWASNPARVSLFGPVEEMVLFRDDVTGRLRRTAVSFPKIAEEEEDAEMAQLPQSNGEADEAMEIDIALQEATSHQVSKPKDPSTDNDTKQSRKLVKTILDQGYLAPFPVSIRPVLWDFASSLSLYPLPSALVLADAEAPAFAVMYEGCHVMNPGRVVDALGGRGRRLARWVEYDVAGGRRKGVVRDVRF